MIESINAATVVHKNGVISYLKEPKRKLAKTCFEVQNELVNVFLSKHDNIIVVDKKFITIESIKG
jgi:hypothetical protein